MYITENQSVYHVRYSCSHLQLQIEMVAVEQLQELRNESGGRYGRCGVCGDQDINVVDMVYITPTGGSYHLNLGCSGLKRTITSAKLEDLMGKGACQRCG